jgi:serine/threonine-protein kinase RsbW
MQYSRELSRGRHTSPPRSVLRWPAHAIESLSSAVSTWVCGAAAPRAENAESRTPGDRGGAVGANETLEVRLPLDFHAPGAARSVVERLRGRVRTSVVEDARLLATELVTNSVRHSGALAGTGVVVRLQLAGAMLRLEVEDSGRGGAIAPRAPDVDGGFGLNLVQRLGERWGFEHVAAGGTRVWVQLANARAEGPQRRRHARFLERARGTH